MKRLVACLSVVTILSLVVALAAVADLRRSAGPAGDEARAHRAARLAAAAAAPPASDPALAAPAGEPWAEYLDQSDARIVADETDPHPGDDCHFDFNTDEPVGLTDKCEKDLAAGDVDRDGDDDMVIVRKRRFSQPGGVRNVLYMNESGALVDRTAERIPDFLDDTDDRDVALVDVDGDQWLDIVTATTFAHQPRVYMNQGNSAEGVWQGFVWRNTGGVDDRIPPFAPAPQFCALGVGDVDNDGDADLFFVDYLNNTEDRLLINDGEGFFTDETLERFGCASIDSCPFAQSGFGTDSQIIDVNGDGFADLTKVDAGQALVIYNEGAGNPGYFDFMDQAFTGSTYMMEALELNNDDAPDLYIVNDSVDAFLLYTGNDAQNHAVYDSFNAPAFTSGFGGNTRSADLNGDGFRDILVADVDTDISNCTGGEPFLLANDANPPNVTLFDPFGGVQQNFMPEGTFDYAVLDVNGDGWPDLWAGTCTGNRLYVGVSPELFASDFEAGDTVDWDQTVAQ